MLYRSVQFSIQEQLLCRNVKRFRGGLVFKAHRLWYHPTLGSRIIKKKKKQAPLPWHGEEPLPPAPPPPPPESQIPPLRLEAIRKSAMLHTTVAFDFVLGLKTRVDDSKENSKSRRSFFRIEPVSAWAGATATTRPKIP